MKRRLRLKPMGIKTIMVLVSTGALLAYFLMNLCLSSLFMDNYYMYQAKKQLLNAYETVLEHPDGDLEAMATLEENNIKILLVNPDTREVIYNSRIDDRIVNPMLDRIIPSIQYLLQNTDGDYAISINEESEVTTSGASVNIGNTIYLGGRVGDLLVEISTAIAPIENASRIAIQFSIVSGLLLIVVTGVVFARLAVGIIRPLQEMEDVAGQIAKLDFSKRCDEGPENELGRLSRSINKMSDTMQQYIAELKAANQQLRTDIMEKEKNEQARRSLIDNLSHDLKTPIALISGYAEGLGSGMAKTPETVKEYCDVISDESDRMLDMITRMLALSRVESGSVELEPEVFNLSEMLDDLVGMFAHKAETEHITIRQDYPEQCYVVSDYVATEQVLTNYLQNAMTHLKGSRRVRVSVVPGELVRINVYNTADPIPEEEQEKIWDSFYRGEKSRHRRGAETGLGLAIVKSNMELMHLPYGMENGEDGVTFWIELPRADSTPAEDDETEPC